MRLSRSNVAFNTLVQEAEGVEKTKHVMFQLKGPMQPKSHISAIYSMICYKSYKPKLKTLINV